MPYTVEARDQLGRLLASIQLARALEASLPRSGDSDYPVLRFLDEYGDTIFNFVQMTQLIIELGQLRIKISDKAALDSIDALEEVARAALGEPHAELIFIGD